MEPYIGGYRHSTRYPIGSMLDARSAGVTVSYTTVVEDDVYYVQFNQYYPQLLISYSVVSTKHHVEFSDVVGGVITMVIVNNNTKEACEYELDGVNEDDIDSIPCKLNQYVPVDIAGTLGIPVDEVYLKPVPYITPSGNGGSSTGDAMGFVKIYVTENGDYVMNTSNLKLTQPETILTVTVP